uniref:CCHC-type domain-containing protein n=1 Tax=Eutreptiella gymnastica TaxID=73025 RepID=A0A7S4LAV6_9EUGL
MKTRECKRCGEVGHFVKDCSSRNKPLKGYVAIDPSTQQMACNFCGLPGCYDRGERCPERLALKPDTVKNQPPGILDVLAQPHRQVSARVKRPPKLTPEQRKKAKALAAQKQAEREEHLALKRKAKKAEAEAKKKAEAKTGAKGQKSKADKKKDQSKKIQKPKAPMVWRNGTLRPKASWIHN